MSWCHPEKWVSGSGDTRPRSLRDSCMWSRAVTSRWSARTAKAGCVTQVTQRVTGWSHAAHVSRSSGWTGATAESTAAGWPPGGSASTSWSSIRQASCQSRINNCTTFMPVIVFQRDWGVGTAGQTSQDRMSRIRAARAPGLLAQLLIRGNH